MDPKITAQTLLRAMVDLPRSGSGSEVAALERLAADVVAGRGPARRPAESVDLGAGGDGREE